MTLIATTISEDNEMETFHTDLPHIMHEMLDGEVVVVNLDNGTYYSFDGVGGQIWEMLGNGGSTLEVLQEQLGATCAGDRDQICDSVERFVDQLRVEGLVRIGVTDTESETIGAAIPGADTRQPFVEPQLQKYTDMEALLLADPIHEVDDTGWPNLK